MVGLNGLMDNWIRVLGEVKPKKETEPTSGVEDTPTHTTSKKKSRKEVRGYISLEQENRRSIHVIRLLQSLLILPFLS